jgi:hypothetical protein
MDFGDVALAGGFLKPAQFASEQRFRLRLSFCKTCFAVQVPDRVDAEILFRDYFYFSSAIGTLRSHFEEYAREITQRFLNPSTAVAVEFGCNDGVLLKPMADLGVGKVIGVDPAANVLASIDDSRLTLINAFFDVNTAKRIVASSRSRGTRTSSWPITFTRIYRIFRRRRGRCARCSTTMAYSFSRCITWERCSRKCSTT